MELASQNGVCGFVVVRLWPIPQIFGLSISALTRRGARQRCEIRDARDASQHKTISETITGCKQNTRTAHRTEHIGLGESDPINETE